MTPAPKPRANVAALSGYHSAQVDVPIKLNTNESPVAPPQAFLDEWADTIRTTPWNRYPDREARALRSAISNHYAIPAEHVWAGNGSNEVLQAIFLAYAGAGRSVLLFEPTYTLHRHIAEVTGATVLTNQRSSDFRIDASIAARSIREQSPDVVMLCSPNNPTGTVETAESIDVIVEAASASGSLVVIDEAYGEFSTHSSIGNPSANVVVVRTFSKVWSLAGLRLGFAVADASVIAAMEAVALPYHLSSATQIGGTLALGFAAEMRQRVDALVDGRNTIESALAEMDVEYWPSGANFVLFRPRDEAHAIWKELLSDGVLVRDCSSWSGLTGCLRVTVGTPEENLAFITALTRALGGQR